MPPQNPKPHVACKYVAFIDEAGDFGLRYIAPVDQRGASEWLILSAVVIRATNENASIEWLKQMRAAAKNTQSTNLHFRRLNDRQKKIVCSALSDLDVRLFVVISNKQNMRRHKNELAASVSKTRSWLYWWMCRLLLERVTDFCERRNRLENTPGQIVRLILSKRNDLWYWELSNYLARLWAQDRNGTIFLPKRTPKWSVIDFKQIFAYEHGERAGLQFADVVASAFYEAVNRDNRTECNPTGLLPV